MLRPTLAEMLMGIRRTITETLMPELDSPYAQSQAMTAANVLAYVAASLETAPNYDRFEVDDLRNTFEAISRTGNSSMADQLRSALEAARQSPPNRPAMEAAMAEFVTALALKRLPQPLADEVRGYVQRHLGRMIALLAPGLGALGQ